MSQPTTLQQTLELAVQHHQAGRFADAINQYRQVLAQRPDHPEIWNALGNAFQMEKRYDDALNAFQKALEHRPNFAEVHYNIGNLMLLADRKNEAIKAFQHAVALKPNFPEAFNNLGHALKQIGKPEQAIAAIRQAVAIQPNFHPAWCNLARGLYEAGQFEDASDAADKAITTHPASAEAHHLAGNARRALGQITEAIAAYQRAIELNPKFPESLNSLGTTLLEIGRFDEAQIAYEKAIVVDPSHAQSHHHLGMLQLLRGDFERGWRETEWRWRSDEFATHQSPHPQPIWNGNDPSGKTIYVFAEQGLGDVIQFARYVSPLAARGAKVVIGCQSSLRALLETLPSVTSVCSNPSEIPPFDLQISVASLPHRFGTTVDTIPAKVPYLHANLSKAAGWKDRIEPRDGLKIGLTWAGRPEHARDRERSIRLAMLAPLAQIENARFFSLQKGGAAAQANDPLNRLKLTDWSNDLHDFDDTAALIENLDLVICVDTSVAHLAGAMGKPIWVLLPFVPDWRWMLGRADSPWYPTMRLFRQPTPGNWTAPIAEVVEAIQTFKINPR